MSKVLYIKANKKPEGVSRTFKISDEFIAEYKEHHPDDEIVTLDLYKEGVDFLPKEVLVHTASELGERNHPILKYAYQFLEADKYVFAEPLWNLCVPAILKAYVDYITVNNITFKYTENGPVGLCQGKKAINITSRGGEYSEGSMAQFEMGDRYLRTIIGFLGVTDFTTVAAEGLDEMGKDVEGIVSDATRRAKDIAKGF